MISETENEDACEASTASNKRKKRSANFTPNETILLMSVISKFKHIVENKKTDGVSVQGKNSAWKKITDAFNSANPESRCRSTESLKKLFDNKKRDTRKQKAEERKEIFLTGGGTSKIPVKDPAQDLILSIVDPLTVVGGTSYYGSDSMPLTNQKKNDDYFTFELGENIGDGENENIINEKQQECDVENHADNRNNWKTGSDLLRPISTPLNRPREEQKQQECDVENHADNRNNWKTGSDLLRPISTPLKRPREEQGYVSNKSAINKNENITARPLNRRRPTETVVRSLASTQLAEKYNQLADKKNVIADYVLKKLKLDMQHATEEHDLRIEALRLEIESKKVDLQIKKQQI